MKKIYTSTLLFLFISLLSFGQINTEGSEFWIDYHTNLGVGSLKLFIASPEGAKVEISNSHVAYSNQLNIEAGALQEVVLPAAAYLQVNGVSSNTFHIVSDSKIAVYGVNYNQYTTDAYVALPKESWGTEYRVATNTNFQHQISVIAGEDNTEVVVTDAAGNTLWGTTLMEGQVYYYTTTTSLAGALVSSNNPVALFAGADCANLPGSSACDHLVEQLPPTQSFGQNFIVLPSGETNLGSGNADFVQIIANEDNTVVTSLTDGEFVLNAGDERYYQYTAAEQIVANKPILVIQYGRGTYNGNGTYGDPMMMVIPPQDQFLKGYIVGAPQGFQYHFLNIVVSEYSYTGITLDGVTIPESEFSEVGESGYYGARIQVSEGNHTIKSSMPFGVFSYGINDCNSYGFAGGMSLAPVASVDQLGISPTEQTVDVKEDGNVTATVLDSDGVPMEGILVNFYVSGIGELQGGAYTDASGKAVYTYTRTDGGVDHIYAKVLNISSSTVTVNWYEAPRVPVIVTNDITDVDSVTATFNGTVTDIGHQDATQHGFCWGENEDPDFESEFSNLGAPTEGLNFSQAVTGLSAVTQYYVRTYAINDLDTVFGGQKAFVTAMIDQKASPASNVGCNRFTVNWEKNSSATGYKLDISEFADFRTYLAGYENKLISSNDIVSEDVSELANGKTYYYRLQGINSEYGLNSEYSTTFSVTIEDKTPPEVICKDTVLFLNVSGTASIDPSFVDNGSSDNCSIATMTLDITDFNCSNIGENTVTLTVTDPSGNVASNTAMVTVVDSTEIIIEGPSDITVQNDPGQCGAVVTFESPIVIDNCTEANFKLTEGFASGSVFPVGTTQVKFTTSSIITDAIPTVNLASTATGTPMDVAYNPEKDLYYSVTGGSAGVPIETFNSEGTLLLKTNNSNHDWRGLWWNPNTNKLEGNAYNSVGIKKQQLNSDGYATHEGSIVLPGLQPDYQSQGAYNYEDDQIIYYSNGNIYRVDRTTNTYLSQLTITGLPVPVSSLNQYRIGYSGINKAEIMVYDYQNKQIHFINKADGSYTSSCQLPAEAPATSSMWNVGFANNQIFINSSDTWYGYRYYTQSVDTSCSFSVTVQDTELPVVNTQNVTIQLDENGLVNISASDIDNSSTDNCGIASMSLDITDFDCEDVGENTLTLTVVDVNGSSASNTAVVTVQDTIAPIATCKPITVYLDETGLASIAENSVDNGSADACGISSYDTDTTEFSCSDVFETNIVTLTVTDVNGNWSSCTSEVTVLDTISPVAVCQAITVYLDETGFATIAEDSVNNGSDDACGISSYDTDTTGFDCSDVFETNTVTLTVTDVNGNWSACTSEVTVLDTISPIAVCKPITVYLDETGFATIAEDSVDNGSADVCAFTFDTDTTEFGCSDVFETNIVTLTVTDASGNWSSCQSEVTVLDTISPVAVCQPITVYLDETGFASIAEDSVDNGSADACAFIFDTDTTEFGCSDVFETNIVTLTVTDASGNWSSCQSEVTVLDTISPVAVCQAITVYLDETGFATIAEDSINNGSADACGISSYDTDTTEFSCSDVFETNIVTLTVTDVNGNWSACTSEVTVLDTISPIAVCKPITVYLDETGFATIAEDSVDNGSADACAFTFDTDTTEFGCSDVFETNIVTMKVTDASGNWSSCTSEVTVLDTIKPTVICRDTTLHVGETGIAIIDSSFLDNGSYDACGIASMSLSKTDFTGEDVGSNLVELSMTDVYGNVSSCVSTVTVRDTVAPVVSCKDIGLNLGENGSSRLYALYILDSAFDAGGIVSYDLSKSKFNCSNVGNNVVELTVTDVGGNIATCSANLEVYDNVGPEVLCNNLEVYLNEEGIAEIEVPMLEESANDACGIAEKELSNSRFTDAELGDNTVTLFVTDVNGNVGTCESTVTVYDTIFPVANCNAISIWLSAGKSYELTKEDMAALAAGSYDNATVFDNLTIDVVPNSFNCDNIGHSVPVTVSITDKAGNESSCETKVFVSYSANKNLEDIHVDLPAGDCETTVDYPAIFTGESCATLTLLDGLGADGVFPVGTTVETWEVTLDGVKDTISFLVTVSSGNKLPTIDPVANITASKGAKLVVNLTGISDGGDCIAQELSVSATSENMGLIENIVVDYTSMSSTGKLEISLAAGQSGTALVIVQVEDEKGALTTSTFRVVAGEFNHAPVLTNPVTDQEVEEGAALNLALSKVPGEMFMDPDGDELVWSFTVENDTVPAWMEVTETAGEFVFDFTPQTADTGCYNIVVAVEDPAGATATDTFELCVLRTITGIGDINEGLFAITMYPNPTTGKVYVENDSQSNENIAIVVFSASGSEVLRKEFRASDRIQFDLSDQVAGFYLVTIKQGERQVVKKLILDRK